MLIKNNKILCIVLIFTAAVVGLGYYYINQQLQMNKPTFTALPHNTVYEDVNYFSDIQPILDRKCVACHSCFDAPCQLKLANSQGVLRGATGTPVYNGKRTDPQQPTRLNLDGNTEVEWRNLGFHSVLAEHNQTPLLKSFIEWGFAAQNSRNKTKLSAALTAKDVELGTNRKNECVATTEAFNEFTHEAPHNGMPLATQGLSQTEYDTVMTWFDQGATIPDAPWTIDDQDKNVIEHWEAWLNENSNERKILARYLYEHLFLAHLYLQPDEHLSERILSPQSDYPVNFYRLVRSSTPSGSAINPINTALPNQAPHTTIYYRLQPVQETIAYKNHIPYRFDSDRLKEIQTLFNSEPWEVDTLPGYTYAFRSNPFKTFNAIPAKLRYQFLLQDAEYFVRSFIRGPVCHGPIATDVIRDHFWVMFENPETEMFVNNKNYRESVSNLLALPGENSKITEFGDEWKIYKNKRNQYEQIRNETYRKHYNTGRPLNTIWTEDGKNPNSFLTVYRHHNNASVLQGWQGQSPRTAWVLDYPLFERTYYELVAGFNVFGNVSHQLQTRLYFDLIRHGGETNFLAYIPNNGPREEMYKHWNQGLAQLKTSASYPALDTLAAGAPELNNNAPKMEFFNIFFEKFPATTDAFDPINRAGEVQSINHHQDNRTDSQKEIELLLASIASKPAKDLTFIADLPDLSLLLVTSDNSESNRVYSIVRNKMHTNVTFLMGETLRYQPEQDYLSVQKGLAGGYPNLIFTVDERQLEQFVNALKTNADKTEFKTRMDTYILKRMSESFWDTVHKISDTQMQEDPIPTGLLDLNRYGYW